MTGPQHLAAADAAFEAAEKRAPGSPEYAALTATAQAHATAALAVAMAQASRDSAELWASYLG